MNHPTESPPHPLELAVVLLLLIFEALRPVLVHSLALVLTLAGWRPAGAAAAAPTGAAACTDALAADCTPAPRPVAKGKTQRRTRRTRTAAKGTHV